MNSGTLSDQFDVPESESSEVKEVFAFFGLATYAAQVAEAELINLCVALEASRKRRMTRAKMEDLFRSFEERTFGTLLRTIRNDNRVSLGLRRKYESAAVHRNALAHTFFRDHSEDFLSEAGRTAMVEELRHMTFDFRDVDAVSEALSHSLYRQLGVSEAFVKSALDAMQERAKLRDRTA
jgi:hypothetical protein